MSFNIIAQMYQNIRPILFSIEPERVHRQVLSILHYIPGFCFPKPKSCPVQALGQTFPHPLGLAAGLDKNAQHLDALAKLGFAFIEVGTVTPKPQLGNPKPRLFRLPTANALINRMGFNNLGVDALVANIQKSHYEGILGINIGKNKETPLSSAVDDYRYSLQRVYPYADYVTINISSPNTADLRQLQADRYFIDLITELKQTQMKLADKHQRHVPLLVKISPDETDETLQRLAEACVRSKIEGIIAVNTTCSRTSVMGLEHENEAGGLSGRPLHPMALNTITRLKKMIGCELVIIGVGGIDSAENAQSMLQAGATLLQIYTGLIYQGPAVVSAILS